MSKNQIIHNILRRENGLDLSSSNFQLKLFASKFLCLTFKLM